MSRTWDLTVAAAPGVTLTTGPQLHLRENHDTVTVEIEYPDYALMQVSLEEERVREMRDWLSWFLGEGPEPGSEVAP